MIVDADKKILLVEKTNSNTKITEIENKVACVTRLGATTMLKIKAPEIENKTPVISNVATKDALKTKARRVEYKISDIKVLCYLQSEKI